MFGLFKKKATATAPKRKRYGRNYMGAMNLPRLGDFTTSSNSANAELDASLETLRTRARSLERNSPYFRRWINQVQTNVVGAAGFTLQVNARNLDNGIDRSGNRKVIEKWQEWCKVATADGMMSFREASRMVSRSWARDGEVFCEIVYGARFTHGMALHFFEPDMVDHTMNRKRTGTTNEIRMGVEIDRFGRPIAYHVLEYHPGDVYWQGSGKKTRRVPADRIIHVFIKSRPGQVRGEPPVSAALLSAKMLDGYRDAEVTGRRMAAAKGGFFVTEAGASGDLESIADRVDDDDGELEIDVHPGRFTKLPEGMRFDKFDMSAFSTDYRDFESQIIHAIAMALNTSYISISGDLTSVSYSSIRAGELSDRDVWREMQKFFIERFAEVVYSRWIDNVFQFSDIRLPYDRRDKWRNASSFRPRGWSWVDPEKEVRAAAEAIDRNMTTLTDVVNEQGGDVEEILRKKQSEAELAADYAVDLGPPRSDSGGDGEG